MYLLVIDSHSICTSVGQCTSARTQEVRNLHLCWTVHLCSETGGAQSAPLLDSGPPQRGRGRPG